MSQSARNIEALLQLRLVAEQRGCRVELLRGRRWSRIMRVNVTTPSGFVLPFIAGPPYHLDLAYIADKLTRRYPRR